MTIRRRLPRAEGEPPLPGKYFSVRTVVDGITFASKKEAQRYGELRLLAQAGLISDLVLQPRYPIVVNGVKVCTYVGDFRYLQAGRTVLEDVKSKGTATPIYRLKKRLLLATQGIRITEWPRPIT